MARRAPKSEISHSFKGVSAGTLDTDQLYASRATFESLESDASPTEVLTINGNGIVARSSATAGSQIYSEVTIPVTNASVDISDTPTTISGLLVRIGSTISAYFALSAQSITRAVPGPTIQWSVIIPATHRPGLVSETPIFIMDNNIVEVGTLFVDQVGNVFCTRADTQNWTGAALGGPGSRSNFVVTAHWSTLS